MARPDVRMKTLGVRLPPDQWRALERLGAAVGKPPSQLAREALEPLGRLAAALLTDPPRIA